MIKVAVAGYGYWGPNLVRNFTGNPDTEVSYICDLNEARLRQARGANPGIETTTDYRAALKDRDVSLVAIATPVSTHYKLAYDALKAGKHVLLEKPFTKTVAEAGRLLELADKNGLKLFVDHTFVYTGAVRKLKEMISAGQLGEIYYFDSVRVNLGLFQHDVNVIWDLAPHDFSIMDYLLEEKPAAVSAIGAACVKGKFEDTAYVSVKFNSGVIAHFNVNWLSPVKLRRVIIGGSKKMVVFDDLNPDEKIKIYDKGITFNKKSQDKVYESLVQYRIGDMHSPKIESSEALKVEIAHIVDCIKHPEKKPLTGGEAGLRVVRLLEACQHSLKKNGAFVKV